MKRYREKPRIVTTRAASRDATADYLQQQSDLAAIGNLKRPRSSATTACEKSDYVDVDCLANFAYVYADLSDYVRAEYQNRAAYYATFQGKGERLPDLLKRTTSTAASRLRPCDPTRLGGMRPPNSIATPCRCRGHGCINPDRPAAFTGRAASAARPNRVELLLQIEETPDPLGGAWG